MRKSNYQILKLSFLFLSFFTACKDKKKEDSITEKPIVAIENKTNETGIGSFKWESELCTYTCTYDKSKFKKGELEQTLEVIGTSAFLDVDLFPVFNLHEKIQPITVLERNYSDAFNKVNNLTVINNKYWTDIKKLKLEELKTNYDLQKLAYNAYYKDISLLKKTNYKKEASFYVDALISEDSLKMVTAWRKLTDAQKLKNADPNNVESEFQERLHSLDCLDYAKMELFSFGWWNNCLDKNKSKFDIFNNYSLYEKFKTIFIKTEEECDEP